MVGHSKARASGDADALIDNTTEAATGCSITTSLYGTTGGLVTARLDRTRLFIQQIMSSIEADSFPPQAVLFRRTASSYLSLMIVPNINSILSLGVGILDRKCVDV